ncbi:MAG: response regulator [Caldilineae bacterium]|nr:MAG: response regulator [Caldilineae bacterium]
MTEKQPAPFSVLVVEDSRTQLAKLRFLLEKEGFAVFVASNGREALERLQTMPEPPTLIISDIVMPEMDGYELCRRLKQDARYKAIPIMLLTQLSGPEDILKGLEVGADNFLTKPYEDDALLARIQYILVNRDLRSRPASGLGLEIVIGGKKHRITADRLQIVDLLFSTYETIVQKNRELERKNRELQEALDKIKRLEGLIPICANCKKIRDDDGYWHRVEEYIEQHADVQFSHGLCPECRELLYPDFPYHPPAASAHTPR